MQRTSGLPRNADSFGTVRRRLRAAGKYKQAASAVSKLPRLDEKTASAALSSYVCAATVCRGFRDVDDMLLSRRPRPCAAGIAPAAVLCARAYGLSRVRSAARPRARTPQVHALPLVVGTARRIRIPAAGERISTVSLTNFLPRTRARSPSRTRRIDVMSGPKARTTIATASRYAASPEFLYVGTIGWKH